MAAVCCRLAVWSGRRPCDKPKMDAWTTRVRKLQSYLVPWLSIAKQCFQMQPAAERTQRSLTTPAVSTQLLLLFMRHVSAIHVNKCQILSSFILSAAQYLRKRTSHSFLRGEGGGWRPPASSDPGNLCSSKTSVYLHSPKLAMSDFPPNEIHTHFNPSALSPSICVLLMPVRSSL